jgi:hypothetical protein
MLEEKKEMWWWLCTEYEKENKEETRSIRRKTVGKQDKTQDRWKI